MVAAPDDGAPDPAAPDQAAPAVASADGAAVAAGASVGRRSSRRSASATWQKWSRLIHAYTSMIALLIVLFFGVTGITLNHPTWTLGDDPTTTTTSGELGVDPTRNGSVDFLAVSEFLRSKYAISAPVSDHQITGSQATISYRAPGYAADAGFDVDDGSYRLTIEEQGYVGVLNDLHKGRDSSGLWKWVIDISAGFLVVIALSGLMLQLVLKRRRRSAVIVAVVGGIVGVVLMFATL